MAVPRSMAYSSFAMTGEVIRTGVVLSGGGARGAFEAGVMQGVMEVLGRLPRDPAPFSVYAGTSVGAINATYLAANAHRGDLGIDRLVRLWKDLRVQRHLRIDVLGFLGMNAPRLPFGRVRTTPKRRFGHHFLDPQELEKVVQGGVDWRVLHENVRHGRVHALIVAALHIGSGRTTMFVELAPDAEFRASRDPRRIARVEPITSDHVLGSAAIPMVFPARRVHNRYYCDGGIRFNTPIAPAIRAGANRLLIVSLLRQPEDATLPSEDDAGDPEDVGFPHPAFLIGKILNALLLDPVAYDVYVLERFNRLLEFLEETHSHEEMLRLNQTMIESRGHSYQRIEPLVFTPSEDIGQLAGRHLAERSGGWDAAARLRYWLLGWAGNAQSTWEADLASYILFDGGFAERLIDLGRRDALARADEIRDFFDVEEGAPR